MFDDLHKVVYVVIALAFAGGIGVCLLAIWIWHHLGISIHWA